MHVDSYKLVSVDTIKNLRKFMDCTQEELAGKIGVTVSTLNRWEKGRCRI